MANSQRYSKTEFELLLEAMSYSLTLLIDRGLELKDRVDGLAEIVGDCQQLDATELTKVRDFLEDLEKFEQERPVR